MSPAARRTSSATSSRPTTANNLSPTRSEIAEIVLLSTLDRDGAGEARIAREPPRTLLVGGLTSLRPRQLDKLGVSSSTERLFAFRFDAVEDAARCFDRLDPWSNTGSPLSFARATGQGDGDDDPEDAPDPVPVPVPRPRPGGDADPDPSPLSMVVDTASPRPTDETATNIPSSEPVKTPPRTHPSESAKTPPVPTPPGPDGSPSTPPVCPQTPQTPPSNRSFARCSVVSSASISMTR